MMKRYEVHYKMTAPVSHIGETASTGSYFQMIRTSAGRLPIITGNSVRGTLRDCGARALLDTLGVQVDKDVFNVLFSGGNLSGSMKMDVGKAKAVREHFPFVSLFGGGLGDMILAGKMYVGNLYPVCRESAEITGAYSELSWKNLIDEIEFTRTDDSKNDGLSAKYAVNPDDESKAKASTQMRYAVQYMAAGTEFIQFIYLNDNVTAQEEAALLSAFANWFRIPKLGGMANKGFGFFTARVLDDDSEPVISVDECGVILRDDVEEAVKQYTELVKNEGAEHLDLLGGGKSGKK